MSELHDMVAPYALDALEPEEREMFEAHLAECSRCRADLVELGEGAAVMAASVAVAPPAHVKTAVLSAIAEPGNVVDLASRRPSRLAWTVAIAAAAVAAVFFGLWTVASTRLTDAERVAAVYEAADATIVEMDGSHGPARLVFSADLSQGVFDGGRLADIDEAEVYELWVINVEGARAAGTLRPGESGVLVEQITSGDTFAVTVEDAPGVDQPVNEPVLATEV